MLLKSFLKNSFSLLQRSSVYQRVAVYNLNSNIGKKKHIIDKLLENNKINVMDIGCRGGGTPEVVFLYRHINLIGFNSDKDEISNLNGNKKLASQFNRVAFYNYALDAEEAIKTLYLTAHRAALHYINQTRNINYCLAVAHWTLCLKFSYKLRN